MKDEKSAPVSVGAYIAEFPPEVRAVLRKMRATIRKAAPEAEERISWGMPSYALGGILTSFAAFEKHVSIFPGPDGIEKFKKELAPYGTSKGTVRFPLRDAGALWIDHPDRQVPDQGEPGQGGSQAEEEVRPGSKLREPF